MPLAIFPSWRRSEVLRWADSVEAGVTNPARRFVVFVFGFAFGAEVGLATGARFNARVGNDPARISGSRASLSR